MNRDELLDLQRRIESLREHGDDALVISVGTRGRDCGGDENDAGSAEATVRMGNDTATAGAKYLDDAIRLARRKILNDREARERKAKKAREAKATQP
jgi:hypothetical protein